MTLITRKLDKNRKKRNHHEDYSHIMIDEICISRMLNLENKNSLLRYIFEIIV
jgi:hypothetical protein